MDVTDVYGLHVILFGSLFFGVCITIETFADMHSSLTEHDRSNTEIQP